MALKGAFVNLGAGLLGALPNIVVFQFNPERITWTPKLVQPPPPSRGEGARDSQRQPSPPSETVSFTLRLDATDLLADSNPLAAASGILPTIAALELLQVPKAGLSIDLFNLGGSAKPHQHPPERLPTVLFFWGPFRILPVTVSSLSISETEYDQLLNPVRAEVAVSLTVLTPGQLAKDATLARGAYTYSQGVREVMATLNLANSAVFAAGASIKLPL
jgi:hypothetical protein